MLLSSPHDDDLFKLNGLKVYYPVNESIIEQDMSSCLASQTGSLPLGYVNNTTEGAVTPSVLCQFGPEKTLEKPAEWKLSPLLCETW